MVRFGRCKECFFDVPLNDSTLIPGTSGLYECPDCYYPNDWHDFHGVYDVTDTCSCGHAIAEHVEVEEQLSHCMVKSCTCKAAGYANIQ